MKLSEMPNIGAVVEAQLIEVGITTPEELIKAGSKEASDCAKSLGFDRTGNCKTRLNIV